MTSTTPLPTSIDDPINTRILAVSEDQLQGFERDPIGRIAALTQLDADLVCQRLQAMLLAGTIRRIRQTLITTGLAPGALVAWQVPAARLDEAFDWMFREDPFTGHVVIRSTDAQTPGSQYRLWTTLKVPQGYSMTRHAQMLCERTGAQRFVLLPARKVFALGVGHMRRRDLAIGERTDEPGRVLDVTVQALTPAQWQVLMALKREFEPAELGRDLWKPRAAEAGMDFETFCQHAQELAERGLLGRFSTFLEHVKKTSGGLTVTRYNALFHWAVPPGREMDAGREVGRHKVMTHAYWREGGPDFAHVNIMGVAHGQERDKVLAHKAAIDEHLVEAGIAVSYTNVFWGGRSEIKPSEISPLAYAQWLEDQNIDPADMRDDAATA